MNLLIEHVVLLGGILPRGGGVLGRPPRDWHVSDGGDERHLLHVRVAPCAPWLSHKVNSEKYEIPAFLTNFGAISFFVFYCIFVIFCVLGWIRNGIELQTHL